MAHTNDGVRTHYKEEFTEEVLKLRLCDDAEGDAAVLTGGILDSVT